MLREPQNTFITALRVALLGIWLGLWIFGDQEPRSGTVPHYYLWILPLAVLSAGWTIYACIERRLLAQLVVSICAVAALPAFLIAPVPLARRPFFIALWAFSSFSFFGAGPIHLLDMIAPVVIVPLVWLECSSFAEDPYVAFYLHFAIFVAALPLIYRALCWRLKYGYDDEIPDPEDE